MSERTGPEGELLAALERAARELPPGPVEERLRNYCGRAWEVLRDPRFAARSSPPHAPSSPRPGHASRVASEAAGLLEVAASTCFAVIEELLAQGEATGNLPPLPRAALARVLVSSLLARALWCASPATANARVTGDCSHVVAETLEVLLHGCRHRPASPRRVVRAGDERPYSTGPR